MKKILLAILLSLNLVAWAETIQDLQTLDGAQRNRLEAIIGSGSGSGGGTPAAAGSGIIITSASGTNTFAVDWAVNLLTNVTLATTQTITGTKTFSGNTLIFTNMSNAISFFGDSTTNTYGLNFYSTNTGAFLGGIGIRNDGGSGITLWGDLSRTVYVAAGGNGVLLAGGNAPTSTIGLSEASYYYIGYAKSGRAFYGVDDGTYTVTNIFRGPNIVSNNVTFAKNISQDVISTNTANGYVSLNGETHVTPTSLFYVEGHSAAPDYVLTCTNANGSLKWSPAGASLTGSNTFYGVNTFTNDAYFLSTVYMGTIQAYTGVITNFVALGSVLITNTSGERFQIFANGLLTNLTTGANFKIGNP